MALPAVMTDIPVGLPISTGVCHSSGEGALRRGVPGASIWAGGKVKGGEEPGWEHDSALSSQQLVVLGSRANGKFPRLVLICPESDSKIPQGSRAASDCRDVLGLV